MENQIDPCKFFADIEANPKAHPPRVTVRQWLMLNEHLYNCDTCENRRLRVLAQQPKQQFPERGTN